jgi:hypothetical protein
MAAGLPAIAVTWLCFFLYTIIVNAIPYASFGRLWFLCRLVVADLLVSPALIAMSISLTVMISIKIQTFMGAYQTSSVVVLIVVVFFIGQITGVLFLSSLVTLVMGVAFWAITAIIGTIAIRSFSRQKIINGLNQERKMTEISGRVNQKISVVLLLIMIAGLLVDVPKPISRRSIKWISLRLKTRALIRMWSSSTTMMRGTNGITENCMPLWCATCWDISARK